MAKSSKKKVQVNKEYIKENRHLETLLKYTLRAIDGKSEQLDMLFKSQAQKLEKQIKKLKEQYGIC